MNTKALNSLAELICRAQENGKRTPMGLAFAIDSAQRHMSPETAAELEQLRAEVAALRAERHSTNESLSEAAEQLRVDRDRIAELEKREAIVAEFVAARAEVITAIRNCHPDNSHDYHRWQGHAESRRQLAESLGLPVAWPSEVAR